MGHILQLNSKTIVPNLLSWNFTYMHGINDNALLGTYATDS